MPSTYFIGKTGFSDGREFTADERNTLMRFAISIGTRAVCTTRSILRPLKMRDLWMAFAEKEKRLQNKIKENKKLVAHYKPEKTKLSPQFVAYFGKIPTKSEYEEYFGKMIDQDKEEIKQLRKLYHVSVDRTLTKKLLGIHKSLNPRVTFGYSNVLHERCEFKLKDSVKKTFTKNSSLAKPALPNADWQGYGTVMFGDEKAVLYYENMSVFNGDKCIMESVSHEYSCTLYLTEGDIVKLESTLDKKSNIISKLKICKSV